MEIKKFDVYCCYDPRKDCPPACPIYERGQAYTLESFGESNAASGIAEFRAQLRQLPDLFLAGYLSMLSRVSDGVQDIKNCYWLGRKKLD